MNDLISAYTLVYTCKIVTAAAVNFILKNESSSFHLLRSAHFIMVECGRQCIIVVAVDSLAEVELMQMD